MAATSKSSTDAKLRLVQNQLRLERLKRRNLERMDYGLEWDMQTGAQRLRPEDLLQRERPATPQDAFVRARLAGLENWFIEITNLIMVAFFNYGLTIKPQDKKDTDELKKKLADLPTKRALRRYIKEVWKERRLLDNVVSFWRKSERMTPLLLLPETCKYSDALGLERLKVKMTWKPEDFIVGDDKNLALAKRYGSGKEIELSEEHDEYFAVLTRGMRGCGFCHPRMYAVFRTLTQNESMEVGESMLALALRRVFVTTKLGWEMKGAAGGVNANKQADWSLWDTKRSARALSFRKGRFGMLDNTQNWDEKTQLIWGGEGFDVKWFDANKWNTVLNRLMWFGAPASFMVLTKSVNPFLLGMFKAMAEDERGDVGPYLEHVINDSFSLGVPVKLGWSNRCFYDARLAWDMVKGLMLQGPLSLQTALREADFDPAVEAERKTQEAAAEPDTLLPLHDPAHGGSPAGDTGRPRQKGKGSVNPAGQK